MYKTASRYFLYTLGLISLRNSLKKEENSIDVPNFKGVVEVVHKLKGRIRLRIPTLKGDENGFNELREQLNKINSIRSVETNYITGTILINHTEEIQPTLIVGILIKLLGLEEQVQKPPQSLITKEFQSVKESFSLAVNEKTHGLLDLKSALFLLFISMGVKNILADPKAGPNGYTFLWWGFSMIK